MIAAPGTSLRSGLPPCESLRGFEVQPGTLPCRLVPPSERSHGSHFTESSNSLSAHLQHVSRPPTLGSLDAVDLQALEVGDQLA
jgi:hypothetical protein